jgi:heme-degrading monooxygenase HmoA
MSILVIAVNPTGTAEGQQKVAGRLRAGQTPPAGLIFQVTSPADPGYQVISVWDSLESFTRFRDERLNPALEAEGVSPGHLTIKTFQAANYKAFDHATV